MEWGKVFFSLNEKLKQAENAIETWHLCVLLLISDILTDQRRKRFFEGKVSYQD